MHKKQIIISLKILLGLLFVEFFSFGVSAVGLGLIQKYFQAENNFYDGGRTLLATLDWNIAFLVMLISAPICEEIIYRQPLKHFRFRDFVFSIGIYFIYFSFSNIAFLKSLDVSFINYTKLIVGIIIIGASFLFWSGSIENKKIRIFLIILINFIFGVVHFKSLLLHREWDIAFILNGLFTIIPYFALGLYYTFLRRKYSLYVGIVAHMIINSLSFLSLYVF